MQNTLTFFKFLRFKKISPYLSFCSKLLFYPMQLKYLQGFIIFIFFGFSSPISAQRDVSGANFYTQGNTNRTAAEWEPAIGTMVAWPLAVPYKLVVELAKDNASVYIGRKRFHQSGCTEVVHPMGHRYFQQYFYHSSTRYRCLVDERLGSKRRFCPGRTMYLGDGKYIFATPDSGLECSDTLPFIYRDKNNNIIKTEIDDNATVPLGKSLNIPVLDLPFINTGGNVLNDGLGTAFSSCILLSENKFFNVPEPQFFELNEKLLGYKKYHFLSNFEKFGIQHLDCYMKLLDEERILVAEPPKDHELYPIYENIVENELKKLTSVYGRPYKILRLKIDRYDGDHLAAYTNCPLLGMLNGNQSLGVEVHQMPFAYAPGDAYLNQTVFIRYHLINRSAQTYTNTMLGFFNDFDLGCANDDFIGWDPARNLAYGYNWG